MSIEVEIKKKLGDFQLDVAFSAGDEILALLGASGCGKSMTLKCIAGIERPDEGRIVLDGRVLFDSEKRVDLKPQKRKVGYLFQQYALFPNMTVEQNILAGMRDKKKKGILPDVIRSMHLE
ncbi:MAG: ATP-binding cassette domain-containing protein, partial [Clostridiales bacterium]|nr:ATP-binding cassette domain-containing protein [Clostridiales bacterium]